MKTPAEVLASLTTFGTEHECISQKLEAIREWLATSDGQAYVEDLSEPPVQSFWAADSSQHSPSMQSGGV